MDDNLVSMGLKAAEETDSGSDNLVQMGLNSKSSMMPKPQENFEAYSIMNELENIEQDSLTETAILENKNLVQGIRNIMKARYSPETRNKFSFDEKYDRTMSDSDVIQEWQNWMRSLAGGQTVTTGNDVAWFAMADDDQRALMGASFEIMDKMPGIFNDNVTWGETLDGVRDYAKAGIWDPSTVLGLGIGRLFTREVSRNIIGKEVRDVARQAFEAAIKRGMTEKAAREVKRKVIKQGFRKAAVKKNLPPVIAGMTTDAAIAVGTDQLYQGLRIGSGVQDHRSLPQSAGAALGVIVMPGLFAGTKALAKGFEKTLGFKTYTDIDIKFKDRANDKVLITEQVIAKTNMKSVNDELLKLFQNFEDNIGTYLPWSVARQQAKETVKIDNISGPKDLEDLFESVFLFGRPDDNLAQKGLVYSLAEAGFIYIQRGKDDNFSNYLGDAIKYLPKETVESMIQSFRTQFGDNIFSASGISKIDSPEKLADWFKARSSEGGKILYNRKAAQDIINKDIDNITLDDMLNMHKVSDDVANKAANNFERIKYIQSLWKRALTSHPSTTGLNVKGWAYTTAMNDISDIVLAAVLKLQGRGQEAKGSLLGAARRGYNLLEMNATVEAGLSFLRFRPEVGDELLSEVSGGVESRDVLKRLNLDPNAKINKASEATIGAIQTATGVKLQDEVTKMISFMSALDQNIMKVYGVDYNTFMKRPDAFTEMHTPKFLEQVQTPAINRAKKETYSFSWLSKEGDGLFLGVAKNIERFSNSAGGGFLVPFGRFFNTATAMLGDYSGFNALKHVTTSVGKMKNPFDDEGQYLLSKGIVGWGALLIPRQEFGLGKSEYEAAKERVKSGQTWNYEELTDGSRRDYTYDAPQNYMRILAQALAHRQIDGRVPTDLKEEMAEILVGQTFRQTGDVYDTFKDYFSFILDGNIEDNFMASVELLSGGFSRIVSGGTRFMDPLNTMAAFATGDFTQPDRRQGNKVYNNSIRYIDKIPEMIGVSINNNPERNSATREQSNFDFGRMSGARGDRGPSPAERLAGSIGKSAWKAIRFDGEPELKNRLDDFVQEVFNLEASILIEDGFLQLPLHKREEKYAKLVRRVKDRAKSILTSSSKKSDKLMSLEMEVLKAPKRILRDALDAADYDGEVTDLKSMEDGEAKLQYLLYLIKYADDIMYAD